MLRFCALLAKHSFPVEHEPEEVPGSTMYPTLWRADYWAIYLKVPAQHFTHVPLIVGYVESFRCRAPVATFDSETRLVLAEQASLEFSITDRHRHSGVLVTISSR